MDTGWWMKILYNAVIVSLPAGMIYLRSQFVSNETMEKKMEQIRVFEEKVLRLEESRNHDAAQDSRIADFENRIRNLEALSFSGGSIRGPK